MPETAACVWSAKSRASSSLNPDVGIGAPTQTWIFPGLARIDLSGSTRYPPQNTKGMTGACDRMAIKLAPILNLATPSWPESRPSPPQASRSPAFTACTIFSSSRSVAKRLPRGTSSIAALRADDRPNGKYAYKSAAAARSIWGHMTLPKAATSANEASL